MKRLISLVLVVLLISSCGKSLVVDKVEYKPVGLISMNTKNNTYSDSINYEPCWGNIILGAILVETIIAPIYFYGFSMFNPVSKK